MGELVKISCKASKDFHLAVRNDAPVVVPADSQDPTQIWIKDTSYGERTKDNYGHPAFALVNRATGKVLKHGKQKGHQLFLADYWAGMLDEDILFTESQDFGEGFKTVRMASDTLLNVTLNLPEEKKSLFHQSKHVEVKEGTPPLLCSTLGMKETSNCGRSSFFDGNEDTGLCKHGVRESATNKGIKVKLVNWIICKTPDCSELIDL